MVRRKCVLLGCLAGFIFALLDGRNAILSDDRAAPVDADFIRAAVDRYYSASLYDIRAIYEYVDEYTDDGFTKLQEQFAKSPSLARTEPMQRRERNVSSWWMPDGRYRYEYNDLSRTVEGEEFVFDRVVADDHTLTSMLSVRHLGAGTQAHGSLMQSTENHIGHPDPMRFGMGIGTMPFGKYLADKEITVLGTEPVDGRTCYMVQATSAHGVFYKIWFDPEKDFRAPLIQCLDSKGRLLGEIRTTFRQIGPAWFPDSGKCTYYDARADGTRVATRVESYHTKEARINSGIDPNVFRIRFPPGTTVYDATLKTSYQIPGDKETDKICDALIASTLERAKGIASAAVKDTEANATTRPDTLAAEANGLSTAPRPGPNAEDENAGFTGRRHKSLPLAHLGTLTAGAAIGTVVLVAGYLLYDRRWRGKTPA